MRQIVFVQGPERVMARLRRHAHQAAELLHVLHTAEVTPRPNYYNRLTTTIIHHNLRCTERVRIPSVYGVCHITRQST